MKWIKKTYLQCIPLHFGVWLSFTVFLALLRNHCYSFRSMKGVTVVPHPARLKTCSQAKAWQAKWVVFKIPGFVCKRFLPFFLTPSPLFYLRHLSRGQFDSRSSFFAPKLHRNACYAGYVSLGRLCLKMQIQGNPKFNPFSRIRRFSSSKNINSFFRNLQRFQTLPRVSSRPLNEV